MLRRGSYLIVGLLAWAGMAQAEPVSLTAAVDREEVAIGEPVLYTLTLTRPETISVAWPKIEAEFGQFELYDTGSEPPSEREGTVTEQRWYRLAGFATGSRTIPVPVATYRDASGVEREARGEALTITVTSVLPQQWETLDIQGAKPLMRIRRYGWLWWLLGALGLAGMVGGGWWWRARRTVATAPAPPLKAPHEIALEALERLRQEALPKHFAYEEYYVRLSDIVRFYIEGRFSLRAPEMTTEEFLQLASQGHALSFDHRSSLQTFLAHCDMVKFARYQPSGSEADEAFGAARRFVQETIPAPAPEPAEQPGGRHAA
jgi:hypothetical protein